MTELFKKQKVVVLWDTVCSYSLAVACPLWVCVCICLFTTVRCAKTVKLIEMPFGVWDSGWAKKLCILCGAIPPEEKSILGGIFWLIVKYREYLACAKVMRYIYRWRQECNISLSVYFSNLSIGLLHYCSFRSPHCNTTCISILPDMLPSDYNAPEKTCCRIKSQRSQLCCHLKY